MGHGAWSGHTYKATTLRSLSEGKSFDYSDTMMRSQPRSSWKVNELLDPKRKNQNGDHAGQITRESLDFPEHPNTTPIVVVFDVTGSMRSVPQVLVAKLPSLMQTLIDGGVQDPQILIGAIGDAYSDTLPIQVGQFESDNRIDRQIEALVLEGGGGGGNHESYELMAYFLANYTHLDSVELRDEKGYCFFIGDERIYRKVNAAQVEQHIGEKVGQRELDTRAVFDQLRESFEVHFMFSAHGGYTPAEVVPSSVGQEQGGDRWYKDYPFPGTYGWADVVGQNVHTMPDAEKVCDEIANIVKVAEAEKIRA